MNFTWYDVLVQGIGVLGIIAGVLSFQCKKHRPLMFLRSANEFLFAAQYGLLGAYTGMAMNLIGVARNLLFAEYVQRGRDTKKIRAVFSALFLIFVGFTWQGYKSIMIGIAKVLSTVAYGSSRTGFVRIIILFTSIAWLIYNLSVGAYAGGVCEVFSIISIVIGIVRIDIMKKKEI